MTHQHDKEGLTLELQRIEKSVGQADNLRQKALMRIDILQQQLTETTDELKALGTTPEQAEAELEKIQNEINSKLAEINSMIPYDLLKKYEEHI